MERSKADERAAFLYDNRALTPRDGVVALGLVQAAGGYRFFPEARSQGHRTRETWHGAWHGMAAIGFGSRAAKAEP